jgi:hypothetical protein
MDDAAFEHWVHMGRHQRELVGLDKTFLPILALHSEPGMIVLGLSGPMEVWSSAWPALRREHKPEAAVLTIDSDVYGDPAAMVASLMVAGVDRDGFAECRTLLYDRSSTGAITWLDETTGDMPELIDLLRPLVA